MSTIDLTQRARQKEARVTEEYQAWLREKLVSALSGYLGLTDAETEALLAPLRLRYSSPAEVEVWVAVELTGPGRLGRTRRRDLMLVIRHHRARGFHDGYPRLFVNNKLGPTGVAALLEWHQQPVPGTAERG